MLHRYGFVTLAAWVVTDRSGAGPGSDPPGHVLVKKHWKTRKVVQITPLTKLSFYGIFAYVYMYTYAVAV
jgi:hypothetical protein